MAQQLSQFRSDLYRMLPKRADAVLDLIDALASMASAESVVELSLSPLFLRNFPSVYDAVRHFFEPSSAHKTTHERLDFQEKLLDLIVSYLPKPIHRKFFLFGVDGVTISRPHAHTLQDRSFVHQPSVIRGNKPITIGHRYSLLTALPEPEEGDYDHWIFPLVLQRITSHQKATEVAQEQFDLLLGQDGVGPVGRKSYGVGPKDELCVAVTDAEYSATSYLASTHQHENLVTIARFRSNRKLYRPYCASGSAKKRAQGHPRWYGKAIHVDDKRVWQKPDKTTTAIWTTKRGKKYTVTISAIVNLRMRGTRTAPMHDKPLTLVRIQVTDKEGNAVYRKPLYLIVVGSRQNELTLLEIYDAFRKRFDLEHFFRFGKQKLLLASAQTPDVETEENWCNIALLAYLQLYLARKEANRVRNPWESKIKVEEPGSHTAKSPSEVQRDFARIIQGFGTPAKPPKTRNKPNGRPQGFKPKSRPRFKVVKKT